MFHKEREEISKNFLRLTLTIFLAFGWLFPGPSQATEDPLVKAYEDIQQLNIDINKLTNKASTQTLIDIAEEKYDLAIEAKDNKDNASEDYDNAVIEEATAVQNLTLAQSAVDGQTVTVATALTNKNNAQNELDVAEINLSTANANLQTSQAAVNNAGTAGLSYTVYYLTRTWPSIATPSGIICTGIWNSNSMNLPVCGNRYENFIVKLTGVITVPSHWTSTYFAGYTDDGFRMYVNGNLAVNNWREQGATWSPYSPVYDVSQDKTLDVEIWWYNGGGPGSYHLGWAIPGGWTGAGCDYTGGWGVGFSCNLNTFSSGSQPTQQQLDDLAAAQTAQAIAQQEYNNKLSVRDDKLSIYNSAVSTLQTLQQNLTTAQQNLTTAQQNLTTATSNKEDAEEDYEQAILVLQNAIIDAQKEYSKQWKFEEDQRVAAAIATALANQPQPTPEPTVMPTPTPSVKPTIEPSPEQTKPVDPTPTPTPEKTNEPTPTPTPESTPTVEPSPKPSPQPTDIKPAPSPEPTLTPAEPSPKPTPDNTNIKELIPEKGQGTSEDLSRVIANLTSKDNKIIKLSPEQMAAVGQTLSALSTAAKVEAASSFGVKTDDINILAQAAQSNPAVAAAIVSFNEKAAANTDAPMPYTIADAITEAAAELFLSDPLAVFSGINLEELSDPSQWGKDMTDDQREKAQEVVIPVILVSNIVASVASVIRRI